MDSTNSFRIFVKLSQILFSLKISCSSNVENREINNDVNYYKVNNLVKDNDENNNVNDNHVNDYLNDSYVNDGSNFYVNDHFTELPAS